MAVIQPVRGPDFGRLIQQGIQTFGAVQGLQQRQQQAERREEIDELTRGIQTDPTKLAQLQVLDPERALRIQQSQDIVQRQQIEADERFRQERPLIASQIVGLPQSEQIRIVSSQVERVRQRGGDASRTQGLLDLLQGTPEQFQEAQGFIQNAIAQGEREGFLKPQAQAGGQQTSLVRNAIASGLVPGTKEFQDFVRTGTLRPSTQVTIGGEVTEQTELAKIRAKRFADITEKADVARGNLASLDILDTIDVSTGRAEPMKQAIAAWASSLGVDVSALANVPAGEAFTAEAGKTVLQAMAAQKGPQTESDMRQIRTTVAGLGKDPRANKFINNSARALSLRAIEHQEFQENFLTEKDTLKGVGKAWTRHIREVPMISKVLKTPEGLPLFFHEFETLMKEKFGPEVSRDDIILTWQKEQKKR